jgi:hypothetical protein
MSKVKVTDVQLSECYTLTQAAQVLGVDSKTLQKRLERAGIEPVESLSDRRLRLLTGEQVEQLRKILAQLPKIPRGETQMGGAVKMIKALARRVGRIEELLSRQSDANEQLRREIDARMREWDRTVELLALLARQPGMAVAGQTEPGEGESGDSASASVPGEVGDDFGDAPLDEDCGRAMATAASMIVGVDSALREAGHKAGRNGSVWHDVSGS